MLMNQIAILYWLFPAPILTSLPGPVPMLSSSPLAKLLSLHTCKEEGERSQCAGNEGSPLLQMESVKAALVVKGRALEI